MKKNSLMFFIIINTLVVYSQNQATKFFNVNNQAINNHLQLVNQLANDTSYKFNAIPNLPSSVTSNSQHFPYPIIFVHGLQGSADSWISMYNYAITQGWSFGGNLNYCLNRDGNNLTSTLNDVKDFTQLPLLAADFYCINFNVDTNGVSYGSNGTTASLSNQEAIYKQGYALKSAVYNVLQASGKDKVILLGHSMGGLAARQYLQNSSNWQPDNKHHVAKLLTIGTPHGGSNFTGPILFQLFSFVPDNESSAVRDLRKTYYYSLDSGVCLYGGIESNNVMSDMLLNNFYNVDVNCNGISGDTVIGINQKILPTNLDFTSIIGNWPFDPTGPGDGIVKVADAQLKSFYNNLSSETFTSTYVHTSLTDDLGNLFCGLDEPDVYKLAYKVDTGKVYYGFISAQAPDGLYSDDYDFYEFDIHSNSILSINVFKSMPNALNLSILDSNLTILYSQGYNQLVINTPILNLNIGKYYVKISSVPTAGSWHYPYHFKINIESSVNTNTLIIRNDSLVSFFPNPVLNDLNVDFKGDEHNCNLKIYNTFGVLIKDVSLKKSKNQIDLSELESSLYFLRVFFPNGTIFKSSFIKD